MQARRTHAYITEVVRIYQLCSHGLLYSDSNCVHKEVLTVPEQDCWAVPTCRNDGRAVLLKTIVDTFW